MAGQQQRRTNLLDQFKVQAELAKSGIGAEYDRDKGMLGLFSRPDLTPKDNAQTDLYKAQAGFYKNLSGMAGGGGGNPLLSNFGIGGEPTDENAPDQVLAAYAQQLGVDPDDLMLKPTIKSVRGVPTTVNAPELKQPLDTKTTGQVQGIRDQSVALLNNLKMLTPGTTDQMSIFNPSAWKGNVGNIASKLKQIYSSSTGDKDGAQKESTFATFKAEVDKTFQKYRKDTTGAAAAMKELGWLAPDLPEADDPPERFIDKTVEAISRFAQGEKLLLDTYGQRGFRVGELRKGSPLSQFVDQAKAVKKQGGAFKVGDQKVIDGTTYTRGEDGKWRPES